MVILKCGYVVSLPFTIYLLLCISSWIGSRMNDNGRSAPLNAPREIYPLWCSLHVASDPDCWFFARNTIITVEIVLVRTIDHYWWVLSQLRFSLFTPITLLLCTFRDRILYLQSYRLQTFTCFIFYIYKSVNVCQKSGYVLVCNCIFLIFRAIVTF